MSNKNNLVIEQESIDLDEKKKSLIRDLESLKSRVENDFPANTSTTYNTSDDKSLNSDMKQVDIPTSYLIQDSYSFSAKKEYSQSWVLRIIGLTLIVVAAIMSYFLFNPIYLNINKLTPLSIFFLILPLILVLCIIIYVLFIERTYTKRASNHRNLSLKHSLLGAYLREIPKNDSDNIKIELAKYLFTNLSKDDRQK